MYLAAQSPDRVKAISILDVGVTLRPTALDELRKIVTPLPEGFETREQAAAFLEKSLQDGQAGKSAMLQFLLSNLRPQGQQLRWAFDLIGIRNSLLEAIQLDQSQGFASISCPIQLLRGAQSSHFSKAELEKMLILNPKATGLEISNAGHWLHADNFEDTAQAVSNFLDQVKK
jgi:pimeloyl-ACP methyl ester carboxylesterase